jgi:hypothetical protein
LKNDDSPVNPETLTEIFHMINRENFITGYTRIGIEAGDGTFNAGFSMYSAAWPLLKEYPGHEFQSGLFGTWMFPDSLSRKTRTNGHWFYSDIEGGLGWWRDTEYPTETPKFIMGAVAQGFTSWANGPGAGKERDWADPRGHYDVAQLSPNLLWPPDGVNLKRGTCGQVLGYGYQPLPLLEAKSKTFGHDVPTGNLCWTLFLNSTNLKGPATFVLPEFFSRPSTFEPSYAGKFLDSVPSQQKRGHAMETQYIPWVEAKDSEGRLFARMAPTLFPAGHNDATPALQKVTAYNWKATWDRAKGWFNGGEAPESEINPSNAFIHKFDETAGVEWASHAPGITREERIPLMATEFIKPSLTDPTCLAYAAQSDLVKPVEGTKGELMMLPEYYQYFQENSEDKGCWRAIPEKDLPENLGLTELDFGNHEDHQPQTYVTPEEPDSPWKSPGPAAGPFTARPEDGSEVTYYWYRFADQPSIVHADLSQDEREALQLKVEMMHRHWTKDKDYLAPPTRGELAEIDSALIVTPPKGLEIGYVPIATRQGPAEK